MSASGGCSPAGQGSGLGPGMSMFRWLEVLEKEFDKAFVDVDLLLGEIDPDQVDITYEGRQKMTSLSSCFAQLCHKTQTVFQLNHKLEVSSCCMIHGHCYTVKLRVVRTSCLHRLMVTTPLWFRRHKLSVLVFSLSLPNHWLTAPLPWHRAIIFLRYKLHLLSFF